MLILDDFQLFLRLLNDGLLLAQALFDLLLNGGQAARYTHRLFNPVDFSRYHVHLDLVSFEMVLVFDLKHPLRKTLMDRLYVVASGLFLSQRTLVLSCKLVQVARAELFVIVRQF